MGKHTSARRIIPSIELVAFMKLKSFGKKKSQKESKDCPGRIFVERNRPEKRRSNPCKYKHRLLCLDSRRRRR